jgi:xanthine dehydrogenase YagR molybdenum-binding subunit
MSNIIGKPVDRIDGKLKVTGAATYSAEFVVKDLVYGVTVQSTITKGRIRNINIAQAKAIPGVLDVMTYKNSMSLHTLSSGGDPGSGKLGEKDLLPLQNDRIFYNGQHVAVVIATSFEVAEYAARLITIEYDEDKGVFDIEKEKSNAYQPKQGMGGSEVQIKKGDRDKATKDITLEETYSTPVYHHNAMEPHATIAEWKGDKLTIYDSTQSVLGSRAAIAQMLGVVPDKIRLVSLYIGGGFGSKGFTWPHSVLAPMAAKLVGRPVKIVLDRQQMFTSNGRRSETIQKITLDATSDGKLQSIKHETTSETSFVDEFIETAGVATKMLYAVDNIHVIQNLVRLNKGTPCPMRAPGEAPGTFAIEVAMDELAYKLEIDPVQLRLINYAEKNPESGLEWSEKSLRDCYQKGADAIGWSKRTLQPRSMQENGMLAGYGMATATYPANRSASAAKVKVFKNGHAEVACCTQDIGTGTYTILAQIASQSLGIPVEFITVKLGDSDLPKGPNSGGSQTAASAGPAVRAAAIDAKNKIIQLAITQNRSPLYIQTADNIIADNDLLFLQNDTAKSDSYVQILGRQNLAFIEGEADLKVSTREKQETSGKGQNKEENNPAVKEDEAVDRKKYAFHSFGAQFVKVLVDPQLGIVRVTDCVSVMDIGTVLNLKTAKNQIIGGMTFALGMALMEETIYDQNTGRIITKDLANYHVPVHADIPAFDIQFIDKPDPYISPIGSRGIGEIGITGTTAAIVNAIYHATGKRVRNLPVTPDKLLS